MILREETRWLREEIWLAVRVLLYAPSHRQNSTYHGLCYTIHIALAGTRNRSMGPPWRIDLMTNCTMSRCSTRELHFSTRYSDLQHSCANEYERICFMDNPIDRIVHTTTFITPAVEHWLEWEIAQWVHHERSIWRPITLWMDALLHSYVLFLNHCSVEEGGGGGGCWGGGGFYKIFWMLINH